LNLITWNVQSCRGCNGVVDPARIVATCRDMADADVLCFQEVARNFSELPGSRGEDQFALLASQLAGYTLIEGIGVDTLAPDGKRRQFGNAVFSRLPVLQVFRHLLPFPPDPDVPGMQRVAVEAVIRAPWGLVRVTTTHLAYYSPIQRSAQVERLRALQAEAAGHAEDTVQVRKEGGPFQTIPRPASGVLTADFNFQPEDPLHARIQAPIQSAIGEDVPPYRDSWVIAHPNTPHQVTLGVYDKVQWPEEAYCCDFIFVTEDLAPRVAQVSVNGATDASDHQPVLLTLRN
jgi:endonuclease/exonuclease/phosphatase family metal-dependent hydrolase